eukprot:UN25397
MGSYDFSKPTGGIISVYTLKNQGHPEFVFETLSAVMCMSFSKKYPALLCVGFYNGSVGVYDIRNHSAPVLYKVENSMKKHNDPVWEVRWVENEKSFLSISSDGNIYRWTMEKNELSRHLLIEMKRYEDLDKSDKEVGEIDHNVSISKIPLPGEEKKSSEPLLRTLQACTFDIKNEQCLVGTEFGEIVLYDLRNLKERPKQFEGHHIQVYAVRWNQFHSSTFISGSEDWTVKLWNTKQLTPVKTYDLVAPVGDICWCPFSSTSFTAVTYVIKYMFLIYRLIKMTPVYIIILHRR